MTDYTLYQSPFSWRYGSSEMRRIWSEDNKRRLWRFIWLELAQTQAEFNLVQQRDVEALRARVDDVDIDRALEIEQEIHHDLMAELRVYAEQCGAAGGILHLGATSMDIEDNADALREREALALVLHKLDQLLAAFAEKINQYADLPIIAFTHLQPAEPSTLGYRLALYAQDLLEDRRSIGSIHQHLRGKGFKGAVGTAASYAALVGMDQFAAFENRLSEKLGLPFFPASHQTTPRRQEWELVSALAGVGAALYRFAFDLRLMQSPVIGEWSEPFRARQVGSSAMPFKRNPIHSEKIDSLARALAQMPLTAWHNAAHSLLERTLDDSANRRSLLPEAFLTVDELLAVTLRLVQNLQVHEAAVQHNLAAYAPFAATERVLMALVKLGADRQEMHERIREHAMQAWQQLQQGQPNPLPQLLAQDAQITGYLPARELADLMQVDSYTGIAPQRARQIAEQINHHKI